LDHRNDHTSYKKSDPGLSQLLIPMRFWDISGWDLFVRCVLWEAATHEQLLGLFPNEDPEVLIQCAE
jgi:hypothetical protein